MPHETALIGILAAGFALAFCGAHAGEVEKRYLEENGADIAVVGEHELASAMGRIAVERSAQNISVR